jgi:hypothetical protein
LLPRCQGLCGWAKYTGRPFAVMVAWRAISAPQSQVSERRICGGRPSVAAITASVTVSECNALRAALAGVFWYRPTLEKFLRAALRKHPELLAGVNFGVSKREIADEVVDRLIEGERVYQHASVKLMVELANMQRFPELERHENAEKWLPRAQAAVADLKTYTTAHADNHAMPPRGTRRAPPECLHGSARRWPW